MRKLYSAEQHPGMSNTELLKTMERLQVELQALQFLSAQGITLARSQASVITFEMESLTKEIQHLGTSMENGP